MKHILVAVGSARKGRVADKVLQAVLKEAETFKDITVTVADLAALDLPFYSNEHPPSHADFVNTDERVAQWSALVTNADAVILLTPEYNHTLSAIEKNAIDWLFPEWNEKPVGVVAYGWAGGSRSVATIRELAPVVKMDLRDNPAELYFTKDIALDGSTLDADSVRQKIRAVLDTL